LLMVMVLEYAQPAPKLEAFRCPQSKIEAITATANNLEILLVTGTAPPLYKTAHLQRLPPHQSGRPYNAMSVRE